MNKPSVRSKVVGLKKMIRSDASDRDLVRDSLRTPPGMSFAMCTSEVSRGIPEQPLVTLATTQELLNEAALTALMALRETEFRTKPLVNRATEIMSMNPFRRS